MHANRSDAVAESSGRAAGGAVRALIVDDHPNVRLLLARLLRKRMGCVVHEAANGVEALDLLGRQPFDLVVLDVVMPLMDGVETLEAIRRTPALRNLPVVVLSAVRDERTVRRLVRLGISTYLAKPLRPLDVAERLQGILTRLVASPGHPSRALTGLPAGSRVLVVDGDADFRRVVRTALDDQTVEEAASGAEALRACLARRPSLLIIGQDLGAVGAGTLLGKLRCLPELASLRVLAAATGDRQFPVDEVDGVVQRTFVPTSFRQAFDRLVAEPSVSPALAARNDLRPDMIAATEQVFGMMLGIDVLAMATTQDPIEGDDTVTIVIDVGDDPCALEFALTAPRAMSERMTAQYLQGVDVVTDADVAGTLSEMATIIGSRLVTALRQRGTAVACREPVVARVAATAGHDGVRVGYASAAQDLYFTTALRAVPRETMPLDVPARASRIPDMDMTPLPSPVDADVLEMLDSLQEPGEPDLLAELVALFLRDTPDRLQQLREHAADAAAVARIAHAVKGSAGNLGATHLLATATRLEQAAHDDQPPTALVRLADELDMEYVRVAQHLQEILGGRGAADVALGDAGERETTTAPPA